MPRLLSYRIGTIDSPQLPLDRIARLGIQCVEVSLDPEASAAGVKRALDAHGLRASSVCGASPLADDAVFDLIEATARQAVELGATVLFTSMKAGDLPLDDAYARLRRIGDIAARHGVVVAMETHPDLCHNGTVAARTMAAVDHPSVGINYDTANVYFYNHGIDTVEELKKTIGSVASVHLKDTMGGFEDWAFPDFGEGVVDFAAVFAVLDDAGFSGPVTMELEGAEHTADDPDAMERHVGACAEHLRSLGLVQ